MTLESYVERIGPARFAELISVSESTVYAWASLEKCPRPDAAWKIIIASNGLLTFDSIYTPFMKKHFHGKTYTTKPLAGVSASTEMNFDE
jgi:hypothetical protein